MRSSSLFLVILLTACGVSLTVGSAGSAASVGTTPASPVLSPSLNDFDLRAFGAVGNGIADDGPALQSALNAIAAVKSIVGDLDKVTQVVKVVGFVASDPSFTGQPGVINGASELLGKAFGQAGIHARSAVGVAVLPLDAPVEVEIVVALADE